MTNEVPFADNHPVTHDLGDFKVRRALRRGSDDGRPFIFVDEFGRPTCRPAKAWTCARIRTSTSRRSLLFDGAIEHRDSLGSRQVIEPGAVNLMTAGKGIVHSERSPADSRAAGRASMGCRRGSRCPRKEEIDPAFDHGRGGLPLVEDGAASARVLMGTCGVRSPRPPAIRRRFTRYILGAGGSMLSTATRTSGRDAGRGEAELDGLRLEPSLFTCWARFSPRLSSAVEARVMLMGGGAFTTPRHVFWNFVSSSRDRINQAKEDWKALRFPLIPGDDQEFIPC